MGLSIEHVHRALWRCDLPAATAHLDEVHALEAGNPDYWKLRADVHHRASDFLSALDLYIKLGHDFPSYSSHRYLLVDCCAHLGLKELAALQLRAMVEKAALPPGWANQVYAEGWMPLGMDRDIQSLDTAQCQSPQNRQMLRMTQGQSRMRSDGIAAGLAEYRDSYCVPDAWREAYPQVADTLPSYWFGQHQLPDRLVVQGRGGVGDLVQWLRYVPVLQALGVNVQYDQGACGLHCLPVADDGLVQVLREQGYRVGSGTSVMWTDPFTLFTAMFPVLGHAAAPRYLALSAPHSSAAQVATIRRHARGKPCVGLFWSANESPGPFGVRSPTLQHLDRLFAWGDVHWVIFQRGCQRDQWLQDPRSADAGRHTTLPTSLSYGDTIGCASQLDALVCVDSGLLHACAALGTPCVLLGNAATEWRWESASRTGWYPSVSIVRAPRLGDWEAVAHAAGQAVNALLA